MKTTRQLLFWNANRHRQWSNPARRWWIHKHLFRMTCFAGGLIAGSYAFARYAPFGEPSFANYVIEGAVTWFPNSMASQLAGDVASSTIVPAAVHQFFIRLIDPAVDATHFSTLQAYYTREFPEDRAIAATADLVVPCDGTVMSIQDITNLDRGVIVQVKGLEYPVDEVFRHHFTKPREGKRRYAAVIQLGMTDVHHVRSPADMSVSETIHIPGNLLPLSTTAAKWIPRIYTSNERVSIIGTRQNQDLVALTLVGGFAEGAIKVAFDERISTNRDFYLMTSVQRSYKNCEVSRGQKLGHFEMGSAVVLVFDCDSSMVPSLLVGAKCAMGNGLCEERP